MQKVYRLQKQKYATPEAILSGEGTMRVGGRWNKRGVPLIYTATTPELAILETLVHFEGTPYDDLPPFVLVTLIIPDSIVATKLEDLPSDWAAVPASLSTQKFTEKWLKERLFLALKVPSAIVPKSLNILLNPHHPKIEEVQIVEIESFLFDKRLLGKSK